MWTYETALERLTLLCKRPRMYATCSEALIAQLAIILESMGKEDALRVLWEDHVEKCRPSTVPSCVVVFPEMTDEWLTGVTHAALTIAASLYEAPELEQF